MHRGGIGVIVRILVRTINVMPPLYATLTSMPPSAKDRYHGTSKVAKIGRERKYSRTIDKSAPTA